MRVFCAFFCLSVSAWAVQVPYLRTSVGPLPLARIQQEKSVEDKDSPTGVGTVGMRGTVIAYDMNGGKLAGNRITFDSLAFSIRFNELSLTTSQLVPVIKVSTVRKEKVIAGKRVVYDEPVSIESKESKPIRASYPNVKLTAVTKPGTVLSIPLPDRVAIRISEGPVVKLRDRDAVAKAFQESLDRSLGTDAFWDGLEIKTENLPGILDFAVGQRDLWRKPVTDAAKAEAAKESFLNSLEQRLSQEMPPLRLNGKDLDAEIGLSADGYLHLALGRANVAEATTSGYRFQVETDKGGLTLALRAYLGMLLDGRAKIGEVDKAKQVAILGLNDSERASAAQLLKDLGLGSFEAATLKALAVDLSAKAPALADLSGDEISLTLPFAAISIHENVAPFRFTLKVRLKLEAGRLAVLGITTTSPVTPQGTAWDRLQATVRLLALSALANHEADKLQKDESGLTWEMVKKGDEAHLRLTVH